MKAKRILTGTGVVLTALLAACSSASAGSGPKGKGKQAAMHKPAHHKPMHHKPAHHKPMHHKPAHHKPAHHKPAHHKPMQHKPVHHHTNIHNHQHTTVNKKNHTGSTNKGAAIRHATPKNNVRGLRDRGIGRLNGKTTTRRVTTESTDQVDADRDRVDQDDNARGGDEQDDAGQDVKGEDQATPTRVRSTGLTAAQLQAEFRRLVDACYRPVSIDGYEERGEERFNATWERSGDLTFVARASLTPPQFRAMSRILARAGYQLVHLSEYRVAGQDRRAAIWIQP
jgi:hypothetical protein